MFNSCQVLFLENVLPPHSTCYLAQESTSMDEVILPFKNYLLRSDRKKSTTLRHLTTLERLIKLGVPLTRNGFETYLFKLKDEGKKPKYLNSIICTIKVYGQFVADRELINLKDFKEYPTNKSIMSDEEIEQFLNLPCPKGAIKNGYKTWTLFFSIMAYTGMRCGEVAKLTVNDVDFGRDVFILLDTKTNDNRLVPIPPNIYKGLKEHVSGCKDYLFPSRRGGNKLGLGEVVDNVDWHYNFHTRLKKLGIKRNNLTPYSLRHSFITHMLEEDVNIFKVQKIVGHKKLETTAQYTHLTTKDIQQAIRKLPAIRRHTNPREILGAIKEIISSFELERDGRFNFRFIDEDKSLKIEIDLNDASY